MDVGTEDEDKTSMKKIILVLAVVIGIVVITVVSIGAFRKERAERNADSYARNQGVVVEYTVPSGFETQEESVRELYNLAAWAEETSNSIEKAFGQYRDSGYVSGDEDISAFASDEELETEAMRTKWKGLRDQLERVVWDSADEILHSSVCELPFDAYDFSSCFVYGWAKNIITVVDFLDQGECKEAYSCARVSPIGKHSWKAVPLDIGYYLNPDLMLEGCEADLADSIKYDSYYGIDNEVECAELFSEHYGVTPANLEEAKSKRDLLMHRKAVSDTIAKNKTSDSSKGNHSYSRRRSSSGSSSSSTSSFDPDEHDIEGYYEDNRDEFEDYDDAYDSFVDDESAWEDY